jgi:predicted DNA-binding protein
MSNRMHRTQILLEPEQHQLLSQLAASEGRTLSDMVREMLRAQLAIRQQEAAALHQRRMEALQRIVAHRQQILSRRNNQPLPLQPHQLIDQLREERDEQCSTAAI